MDEPGELPRALKPISDHGGNLLSIFHERGNITPRGYVPVEIDVEAVPGKFRDVVDELRRSDVNVVQAGAERYSESVTVLLFGHLVDAGLSDTLKRIRNEADTSITDLSLSTSEGTHDVSSARLRIATATGELGETLRVVREVADEKDLRIVEPHDVIGEGG